MGVSNVFLVAPGSGDHKRFGTSSLTDGRQCAEKGVLAVLTDEVPDMEGGPETCTAVTETMLRGFLAVSPELDPANQLLQLLVAVGGTAAGYFADKGMEPCGVSLGACLVYQDQLYFLSLGSVRMYLVRERTIAQLNRVHTRGAVLDEGVARGTVAPEEAQEDPARELPTYYIGAEKQGAVDRNLRPLSLRPGDRILMVTGGTAFLLGERVLLDIVSGKNTALAASGLEGAIIGAQRDKREDCTISIMEIV